MIEFTSLVKSAAVVVALWLAPTAPGVAQSAGESGKELLRIQDEWAAARVKRDVAYLERLYAKEFRVHSMNGSVVSREADIGVFASGELKPDRVEDQDMEVSVYGDTALVTGIENVAGTYKGNYGAMALRFLNVFVRRDGHWQLVIHQSTPVPKE
ncbi:nuclear transport factor 2 family protein [Pseudoxanthomonas sp. CF125]|uniref:nuclear transport factor 2 family protein n=1 Tax=Pseudoxanthomonas sp. CF125 TaxID=1855303 RepID=UPI00088A4DE9|nr:nuclear transport factor 2 family protein [Pseudoxanthomonas sp. CF125]SDR13274.1 Ketosteroid isomerase homolog [Pseudoxanthomonas sp. CF125]